MVATGTTDETGNVARSSSRHEMPGAVRWGLAAVLVLAIGGALALMTERGPALLLDLAQMGAKFLCL